MVITQNSKDIILQYSANEIINLPKATTVAELDINTVLLTCGSKSYRINPVDVTSPTVTTGISLMAIFNSYLGSTGNIVEYFIAAALQTVFTPVATPAITDQLTVNGIVTTNGVDWNIVGVTYVFVVPMIGGEVVVARRF